MKELKIFIEGEYDEPFLGTKNGKITKSQNKIRDLILVKYNSIRTIMYAKKGGVNYISKLIKSYSSVKTDYVILADSDKQVGQNSVQICPLEKVKNILDEDKNKIIDVTKIWIVKAEIESWFFAGATKISGFSVPSNTETVVAEDFEQKMIHFLKTKRNISNIKAHHHENFLSEIAQNFDIQEAQKRNQSFKRFLVHFGFVTKSVRKYRKNAIGMLKAGNDINTIMEKTNLSKKEIEGIKKKHNLE